MPARTQPNLPDAQAVRASGAVEKNQKVSQMRTSAEVAIPPAQVVVSRGYWTTVLMRFRREKVAMCCALLILLLLASALLAPVLAPADPYQGSMLKRLAEIGTQGYPLGTDELGRDMLSRLLYGGRLSLFMGIAPVFMAFVIGSLLGVMAGFLGGKVNMFIMRLMDVGFAFPSVLLAVAIAGALGAGIFNSLLSLTIVFIPPITRIAESVTTQIRNLDFVEAARATGAGSLTIIRVHILGNVLGTVFIYATSLVSLCIILASGLSFLGLGTRPPEAEWGLMLNTLRSAIYQNPWVAALPGAMIFVTSICFNLMSDGLRAAMDIKK